MTATVKITVLRRTRFDDLLEKYGTHIWEPCDTFREGQELLVGKGCMMPEGFCSWAWCDIHKYVLTLARGGNFAGSRPGVTVACCSDGYRPVFFAIERVETAEAE
jgi:uncharacterized repeat protein (TIGR04076 family)